jgi:hypothetical protein
VFEHPTAHRVDNCPCGGIGNPDHVYSLKHRAISWVSKNLFDDVTYTVRNGLNKGLRRRGGLGWVPLESSNTPEFQFWKALDLREQVSTISARFTAS